MWAVAHPLYDTTLPLARSRSSISLAETNRRQISPLNSFCLLIFSELDPVRLTISNYVGTTLAPSDPRAQLVDYFLDLSRSLSLSCYRSFALASIESVLGADYRLDCLFNQRASPQSRELFSCTGAKRPALASAVVCSVAGVAVAAGRLIVVVSMSGFPLLVIVIVVAVLVSARLARSPPWSLSPFPRPRCGPIRLVCTPAARQPGAGALP
jgi:hypothetical protein